MTDALIWQWQGLEVAEWRHFVEDKCFGGTADLERKLAEANIKLERGLKENRELWASNQELMAQRDNALSDWRQADTDSIRAIHERNEARAERDALAVAFEMFGRAIFSKVTGHIGSGEGDEWCHEVMEDATKLGLCHRVPYDPDLHGEMEFVPHEDYIWWWGFLPDGWQTKKPPIEFLNARGEPETDLSKRGFLVINDPRFLAAVKGDKQ